MGAEASRQHVNIYGRKAGRGARSYLITLKLICVAAFLGGLMTLLAITLSEPAPQSSADWQRRAEFISRAYCWVIVPGVTGAEIVGLLLFASIWRAMIRMRWFIFKAALILVCMPTLHLFMSHHLSRLRLAIVSPPPHPPEVQTMIWMGSIFALTVGIVLLVLGRIKPRLGQNYARTFGKAPS